MAMMMRLDFEPGKTDIRERVMRGMAKDMGISVERVEAKYHDITPRVGFAFGASMVQLMAWHGRVMTGREAPRYVSGHQI